MEYRQLGSSDLQVSSIGLGSATFAREIDAPAAFSVLDRALERGIMLIDTAKAYSAGRSEEVIGRWLAQRGTRDRIVLATKVHKPLTREHILTSAEESLRRLGTDVIDLFQFHLWDPGVPLEAQLEALQMVVEKGYARYVGCSNYTASQLHRALALQASHGWSPMVSVQPNYNLVVRDIEDELLPLCADQQVGVITYSPLGGGFLTGKYYRGGGVPAGTRMDVVPAMQDIYFHESGFRILEGLRSQAEVLDVPVPRLALAWVLNQPGLTSVLIGARTPGHVDQAFEAAALELSPKVQEVLSNFE